MVIIDNFSKFGWTVPLKNKIAQTIKDSFENILLSSKSRPNLIETDRGKEFCNNIIQDFLDKNNIKLYSRKSSYGAVFAESFNRTIGDLLNKTVFEKGDGRWTDILPTITKQYNNRIHTSTKLSVKKIFTFCYFYKEVISLKNLYKITAIRNDTKPSYKIDNLPERYNESLLK